jgi:hypothetical protein
MSNILKVGDTILWRGSWGEKDPVEAIVDGMEEVQPGEKYGEPVSQMEWSLVKQNYAVVTLNNGHWAYGCQLDPL